MEAILCPTRRGTQNDSAEVTFRECSMLAGGMMRQFVLRCTAVSGLPGSSRLVAKRAIVMKFIVVVIVCLSTILSASAQTVEWTYPLEGVGSAPTLYPDEQHPTGVVVAAGKSVVCLNGNGSVRWKTALDSPAASPACVADLNGDGSPEAVVCQDKGILICLDGEGRERWRYDFRTLTGGFKNPAAADVMPEPGLEVLMGCDDGWLHCVSAQGKLLWRFFGDKFRVSPVAVGDADGDGAPEIVYGTDNGHVYCLSNTGRVKWCYYEFAPYGRSGPNIADLDGDGKAEVLITRSNVGNATCLMALDGATGKFRWRTQDVMQGYVSNAVVNFGGDGKFEVVHGDKGNWVYKVNADGSEVWRTELSANGLFWAPAIGDIDGDGYLEIVAGMRGSGPDTGACAYVLGQDGTVDGALKLGSGANGGPAMGDIDGDGKLEVVFTTEGPSQMQVLSWGAGGSVGWPSLRGNSAMTAATNVPPGRPAEPTPEVEHGEARIDTGATTWGENVWKTAWNAPAPPEAFVELSVMSGDHCETSITPVKSGATEAEVRWQLASPDRSDVTIRLLAAGGAVPQFVALRRVKPEAPEYCDFDAVTAACESAVAAGDAAGADTSGVRIRLLALEAERDGVARLNATEHLEAVPGKATALRNRAAALRAFAETVARFWLANGTGSFIFWQDANPWDTFEPNDVPASFEMNRPVRITACGDELEDVALNLLNVTGEPIDVRCTFAEPTFTDVRTAAVPELARHVTLRRGLRISTRDRGPELDALPLLDGSGVIVLPPGEARPLWLSVSTYGLAPGVHNLTLYLGTLRDNPTFREVPLEIEVLPVKLPTGVYQQINWSGGLDPKQTPDQVLRDLLDHGVTVFYGPHTTVPLDAAGNPAGTVDWSAFDAALARVPDYCRVLFSGPPGQKWPDGIQVKEWDALYQAGFKTAVRVLAEHMNAIGWGYERWAFYPVDEPWNTGETLIPHLRRFCKLVKEADPKARNYADPAGHVRVEKITEFKDLIDVWQPEMNLLKRDPALVKWFRENAKVFWAYEAPGPAKDLLPLGHYRAFAWLAWNFGCEGAGYWCYRDNDLWWKRNATDYGAVYPAGDEVIPSRRWEASRDGVEDYRLMYALREEIGKARAAGRAADADRAQALLDEAVAKVVGWQIGSIDEITRMTRHCELDYQVLMDYRARIVQEVLKLRGIQ
ncbi:MAG: VCBS repeat-containing protein [Candidatus Hydrogenedentes bacterium]|nr:VCBS repeat-containing protein [Candidatus Hydrogenedentota bacterium]